MSKYDELKTIKESVVFNRAEYLKLEALCFHNSLKASDFLLILGLRCAYKVGEFEVMFDRTKEKEVNILAKADPRTTRIQVLCTPTEHALISVAANRASMSVSSFLRFLGMRVATDVTIEKACLSAGQDPEKAGR